MNTLLKGVGMAVKVGKSKQVREKAGQIIKGVGETVYEYYDRETTVRQAEARLKVDKLLVDKDRVVKRNEDADKDLGRTKRKVDELEHTDTSKMSYPEKLNHEDKLKEARAERQKAIQEKAEALKEMKKTHEEAIKEREKAREDMDERTQERMEDVRESTNPEESFRDRVPPDMQEEVRRAGDGEFDDYPTSEESQQERYPEDVFSTDPMEREEDLDSTGGGEEGLPDEGAEEPQQLVEGEPSTGIGIDVNNPRGQLEDIFRNFRQTIGSTFQPLSEMQKWIGGSSGGSVSVRSYSRSTGGVKAHSRSKPDGDLANNFSYRLKK